MESHPHPWFSLQDEINRIKKEWNYQLTQISKEHANENVEHRALLEECDTLKSEVKIKENHILRYGNIVGSKRQGR